MSRNDKWQHGLSGVIIFSFALFAVGIYFAIGKAGLPYQDPTPELARRYNIFMTIGQSCIAVGSLLFFAGCVAKDILIFKEKKEEGGLLAKLLLLYCCGTAFLSATIIVVGRALRFLNRNFHGKVSVTGPVSSLMLYPDSYFIMMIVALLIWFRIAFLKKIKLDRRSIFVYTTCLCAIYASLFMLSYFVKIIPIKLLTF